MLIHAAGMVASHTMPDLVSGAVDKGVAWATIPILIASVLGARIGWKPFRWRRVVGAILGLLVGVVSLFPSMLAAFLLLMYCHGTFGFPPAGIDGDLVWIVLINVMAASIAYLCSMIGRPANASPKLTLDALDQTLNEIDRMVLDRIVRLEGRQAYSATDEKTDSNLDFAALVNAGVMANGQANRLRQLRQMQVHFRRSRTVVHADVENCVVQSQELLKEIASKNEPH